MKLTTFFLLIGILTVTARGFSQQARFDLSLQNGTLQALFQEIENQSEYNFFYKDDRLIFQSETLENIASKLERWYDVRIHIQDEELKQYRYTGEFAHKETLIQVMEILNLTTPIEFTFEKNDVYIKKMKTRVLYQIHFSP